VSAGAVSEFVIYWAGSYFIVGDTGDNGTFPSPFFLAIFASSSGAIGFFLFIYLF
jgi:hypothetical protein